MTQRKIDPQGKKEAVLKEALRLFVERGYHRVSIPDIVRASGVSTGAIYNQFSNKEELARQVHFQTLNDFQERFFERMVHAATTFEKLRAFAGLVFEIAESEPVMMEYMLSMRHVEFLPDSLPLCYSDAFRWVQQIVAEGIARGELKQGDHLLSAVSFTGVVLRAVELRLAGVIKVSLLDAGDELVENAWAAVRA
ncbi:TetR/AcrR family transcriptional regulator [uncultured Desulfuromonas sp.]|uniref:TetR/AcrR family transcriptional regulator n=1 Tax=uncultured Desulfuromonas sp. TaxID=181013 RepID=UPI0026051B04|nr:TetR/AcrR family transcriptional regulator [uncultured Desulfuromonas sp.]